MACAMVCGAAVAQAVPPWMNRALPAQARVELVLKEMTQDEKLRLVVGYFGANADWKNYQRPREARPQSAGLVYGIERLGIPNLWQADAGIGVASQPGPDYREATALPAGIGIAASWDVQTAFEGGAMIGAEARAFGFNVLLAGGANLVREPRNGRNFEYGGEDPLLAGQVVGAQIKGIQSNHIVSTMKHFAFNDQETGRNVLNATVDDKAARTSDLLAFQIANEIGEPGSVMCAYNRVNGVYACESDYLLNEVLKEDWGYKGWVMSDWGATHSTAGAAMAGLDQQSGLPFDDTDFFGAPLKKALASGAVPPARLDDMVRRVLYGMFRNGVIDNPVAPSPQSIDYPAHARVSQKAAQDGMVLLQNTGRLLPLSASVQKIAVIGGYADKGVLAGGGSSLVYPVGGNAVPGLEPKNWPGPVMVYPSSPLAGIQKRAPNARVAFSDGSDVDAAAKLAQGSDVVLVFATQWTAESVDVANLSLPGKQDALIAAVARANPKTVVVLQTGGAVTMPWLPQVGAVLEAWYPGTSGGEAIASVLFGEVNPSGRLPISFPAAESQLPRPVLDGYPEVWGKTFDVRYHEGAAVGYKWYDLKGLKPLFPFGHGLSYTEFAFGKLSAQAEQGVLRASFSVRNVGKVAGKEVAQVYVSPVGDAGWEAPKRLGGFQKLDLAPGASAQASVLVDPRVLGVYDSASKTWKIAAGDYRVTLARSAMDDQAPSVQVHLPAATFDVNGQLR